MRNADTDIAEPTNTLFAQMAKALRDHQMAAPLGFNGGPIQNVRELPHLSKLYKEAELEKPTSPYLRFFVEVLEPVCEHYLNKDFAEMFASLGSDAQSLSEEDQTDILFALKTIVRNREDCRVRSMFAFLKKVYVPLLSDKLDAADEDYRVNGGQGAQYMNAYPEHFFLVAVDYAEIRALAEYLTRAK